MYLHVFKFEFYHESSHNYYHREKSYIIQEEEPVSSDQGANVTWKEEMTEEIGYAEEMFEKWSSKHWFPKDVQIPKNTSETSAIIEDIAGKLDGSDDVTAQEICSLLVDIKQ